MNNQDMPANPLPNGADNRPYFVQKDEEPREGHLCGETKREKAFWQVYSAMIGGLYSDFEVLEVIPESTAKAALEAVNAGFKALEQGE